MLRTQKWCMNEFSVRAQHRTRKKNPQVATNCSLGNPCMHLELPFPSFLLVALVAVTFLPSVLLLPPVLLPLLLALAALAVAVAAPDVVASAVAPASAVVLLLFLDFC